LKTKRKESKTHKECNKERARKITKKKLNDNSKAQKKNTNK
jgi:hypothetical protein